MAKVQTEIAGTERPSIEEIDDAAISYVATRNERMQLTKDEIARKQVLSDAMHKHLDKLETTAAGDSVYVFEDGESRFTCTLAHSEKLKVRKVADDDADVDEEDIG